MNDKKISKAEEYALKLMKKGYLRPMDTYSADSKAIIDAYKKSPGKLGKERQKR